MDGGPYYIIISPAFFNHYKCVEWCVSNIQPPFLFLDPSFLYPGLGLDSGLLLHVIRGCEI